MKQRRFLKFYSIKSLARYLGFTEDFLLSIRQNHSKIYRYKPNADIKGKKRSLYITKGTGLELILKKIDRLILSRIDLPDSFQGGVKGKSLLTNAQHHVKAHEILKIDIKDFFPSVTPDRVSKTFRSLKMNTECANLLADLTTVRQPIAHLPQGFNTSPKIAALTLRGFEHRLFRLAQRYDWNYTFWIDDITISGHFPVGKFKNLIIKMLNEEGFQVSPHKIILLKEDEPLIVNGVVVNEIPNIEKKKRQWISQSLYFMNKYGVKSHLIKKCFPPNEIDRIRNWYQNRLLGLIHYTLSINRKLGELYKRQFCSINWES